MFMIGWFSWLFCCFKSHVHENLLDLGIPFLSILLAATSSSARVASLSGLLFLILLYMDYLNLMLDIEQYER